MGTALNGSIKIIGIFLMAALAAEVSAGIINGGGMGNSTITIVSNVLDTVVGGVITLVLNLPIIVINLVISLLNALLGTSIPTLAYITYP